MIGPDGSVNRLVYRHPTESITHSVFAPNGFTSISHPYTADGDITSTSGHTETIFFVSCTGHP